MTIESVQWSRFIDSGIEFINLREIHDNQTIIPKIKMSKTILHHMNSQGVANLTNNYLTQEKIVNDDFLVLRLGKFDRLLIFDREEDLSKD